MAPKSFHHIEVSPVNPEETLHPGNCQVLMDGKPMLGVRALSLSEIRIDKQQFTTITLELLASVKVSGKMRVKIKKVKPS